MAIQYPKQHQNECDLISLLKARGLGIEDDAKARNYLINIGYFRLNAYSFPLLKQPKSDKIFKTDATFEKVLNLYRFDRKLRLLVFNEIEKIEVALRSIMINTACVHLNDSFWITNRQHFYNEKFFDESLNKIIKELKSSKEDYIAHFKENYSDPYPPSWMISEVMPIGNLCRIYKNLSDKNLKKQISQKFGLTPIVFESWIMTIAGLRNICCHHNRLWNKSLAIKTTLPKTTTFPWLNDPIILNSGRVYLRLCMIKYLLFSVSPNNTFKEKLLSLIFQYPNVDILAMGFTSDWLNEPLWE